MINLTFFYRITIVVGIITCAAFHANAKTQAISMMRPDQFGFPTEIIYARLDQVISNSGSSGGGGSYSSYFSEISVVIKYFADEACTVPYALPTALDYKIDAYGMYEHEDAAGWYAGFYPHYQIEGTTPAGATEILVDDNLPFDDEYYEYENGQLVYLDRSAYDYELMIVEYNYAIVYPTVFPIHHW
jgi:hypothetical protein